MHTNSSSLATDSYRVGKLVHDADALLPLRVLEIDIAALDLTQLRAVSLCPDGVPPVDGLVICYDASRETTFSRVADLIREFLSSYICYAPLTLLP